MNGDQIFQFSNNTLIWTIIGSILGALFGVFFTNIYNKKNSKIKLKGWYWTKCLEDGLTKDPNLIVSIINESKVTIPIINVHIMDFEKVNVELQRLDNDIFEIKSGQITNYYLNVLKNDFELSDEAKMILQANPNNFALRVYIDKSNKGPILTDKKLANSIFHSISQIVGRNFKKKSLLDDIPSSERKRILEEYEKEKDSR